MNTILGQEQVSNEPAHFPHFPLGDALSLLGCSFSAWVSRQKSSRMLIAMVTELNGRHNLEAPT